MPNAAFKYLYLFYPKSALRLSQIASSSILQVYWFCLSNMQKILVKVLTCVLWTLMWSYFKLLVETSQDLLISQEICDAVACVFYMMCGDMMAES